MNQQQAQGVGGGSQPHPQKKRWLIFIKPEDAFLEHVRDIKRSHALQQGVLTPLQPSLAAQLASVAHQFGFPTSSGLVLLLNSSIGSPRIGEDIWSICKGILHAFEQIGPGVFCTVWQDPSPVSGLALPIAGSFLLGVDLRIGWLPVWLSAEDALVSKEQARAARRRLTLMGSFSAQSMQDFVEQAQFSPNREMRSTSLSSTATAFSAGSSEADLSAKEAPIDQRNFEAKEIQAREVQRSLSQLAVAIALFDM